MTDGLLNTETQTERNLMQEAERPEALTQRLCAAADAALVDIDPRVTGEWASPLSSRQPVHTVYVPADQAVREGVDLPVHWAKVATDTARSFTGTDDTTRAFAAVAGELGIPPELVDDVVERVAEKFAREPIEDLRIDFEDGFTQRSVPIPERDADEDARAFEAAGLLASWLGQTTEFAPWFTGIRIKSFDPAVRDRGLRTLVIVLTELDRLGVLRRTLDERPRALRITLPKVQHHTQIAAFVESLELIESALDLPEIPFEIQIETPQAILCSDGSAEATRILAEGKGRVLSLHYGTYDYSAYLGVDAADQSLEHPVADHAKDILQVATSTIGVELSDGSTNRIPTGTTAQIREGWLNHFRLVSRHLHRAIRQGWDLHPNHLVTRHLATVTYFRADWKASAERLRAYVLGDTSEWMDEPATAKALAGYLNRAHACGAISDAELATMNVSPDDLISLIRTGRTPNQ